MESVLPLLLGSSGCLVLALLIGLLFYKGKLHSDKEFSKVEARCEALQTRCEYLEAALADERKAVDAYARTGSMTNQLIAGLVQVASGGQPPPLPAVAHGGGGTS